MARRISTNPDLKTLQDLLMWARKERIALHQVQVGSIAIAGTDRKLESEFVRPGPARDEAQEGIYQKMAGDLAAQMSNGHANDDTDVIEDD